jgi:Pyruvate/2-oxoacid:ferredoxin oxidoreductase delta subunit
MKVLRKIIEIDEERCDGCGQCVPECAEGALQIVDGKAKVVADKYCDGLGACIGECPNDALTIVEKEAEEFDEEAVEVYLSKKEKQTVEAPGVMACGCPSTQIQAFAPSSCQEANQPASMEGAASELTHWPVQIRLVPPHAPFLKNADLLVTADCTPLAFPDIHHRFIKGKTVLMGCPKFDDVQDYIDRFSEIFKTAGIKSITALIMEVPCCSGLPVIIQKAMQAAGKEIPLETVVISTRGKIVKQEKARVA